jgi:hypothetical protein
VAEAVVQRCSEKPVCTGSQSGLKVEPATLWHLKSHRQFTAGDVQA